MQRFSRTATTTDAVAAAFATKTVVSHDWLPGEPQKRSTAFSRSDARKAAPFPAKRHCLQMSSFATKRPRRLWAYVHNEATRSDSVPSPSYGNIFGTQDVKGQIVRGY